MEGSTEILLKFIFAAMIPDSPANELVFLWGISALISHLAGGVRAYQEALARS